MTTKILRRRDPHLQCCATSPTSAQAASVASCLSPTSSISSSAVSDSKSQLSSGIVARDVTLEDDSFNPEIIPTTSPPPNTLSNDQRSSAFNAELDPVTDRLADELESLANTTRVAAVGCTAPSAICSESPVCAVINTATTCCALDMMSATPRCTNNEVQPHFKPPKPVLTSSIQSVQPTSSTTLPHTLENEAPQPSRRFQVYERKWVNYDSGYRGGCDTDPEPDTDSGASTSSAGSSISGSLDDLLPRMRSKQTPMPGLTRVHHSRFKIATYNILTDNCVKPGEYVYVPNDVRYMEDRHPAIMAEIRAWGPDIVCMQEVDNANYTGRLAPSMRLLGYGGGAFHQRSDDQGLAVFWQDAAFELLQQKHCVLHNLAETFLQIEPLEPEVRQLVRRAIERPEVVLLVRLRHRVSGIPLVVANIHVTWSGLKYPALQALQISAALSEFLDFSRGSRCARIICGDFNSPPDSLPYQMLSTGQIDEEAVAELKERSTSDDELTNLRCYGLFHVIPNAFRLKTTLKSAYQQALGVEPPITNCDDQYMNWKTELCLDYFWYAPESLDLTGVLQTPPVEAIFQHYALPSVIFPSDHIPLVAGFVLK